MQRATWGRRGQAMQKAPPAWPWPTTIVLFLEVTSIRQQVMMHPGGSAASPSVLHTPTSRAAAASRSRAPCPLPALPPPPPAHHFSLHCCGLRVVMALAMASQLIPSCVCGGGGGGASDGGGVGAGGGELSGRQAGRHLASRAHLQAGRRRPADAGLDTDRSTPCSGNNATQPALSYTVLRRCGAGVQQGRAGGAAAGGGTRAHRAHTCSACRSRVPQHPSASCRPLHSTAHPRHTNSHPQRAPRATHQHHAAPRPAALGHGHSRCPNA